MTQPQPQPTVAPDPLDSWQVKVITVYDVTVSATNSRDVAAQALAAVHDGLATIRQTYLYAQRADGSQSLYKGPPAGGSDLWPFTDCGMD
jgi:hypothetical protein